jgi:hypothetical protein
VAARSGISLPDTSFLRARVRPLVVGLTGVDVTAVDRPAGVEVKNLASPDAPGHDAWVVGDEPCVALDFISS